MESKSDNIISSNEPEDGSLSKLLYDNLRDCKYIEAMNILRGEEWQKYLVHNSLEIVPILSSILQEDFCSFDTENCIEEMLQYIATIANYKEAMLVFLEEIEIFRSTKQFRIILRPLETLLLQHVSRSSKSSTFSWVFNTLNAHLSVLPLPGYDNYEGDERKLLEIDPQQQDIVETLSHVHDFYEVFYNKIVSGDLVWPNKDVNTSEFFAYFLLHIFHKPLAFLDIYTSKDNPANTLYILCSKFVNMVTLLMINPCKLLVHIKPIKKEQNESKNSEEADDVDLVSPLSLAVYFYCLIGQNICINYIPSVYSNDYLLVSLLPSCSLLIKEKSIFSVHKGLVLFQALLERVNENALPKTFFELPSYVEILQNLIDVMTYCDSKECRILALTTFKSWIWKFNSDGKHQFFISVFTIVAHSGILGVVIHELKENLQKVVRSGDNLDINFCDKKLHRLLSLACKLPNEEKTDILEFSDKIMSALNLLIFLCQFDKQNLTNFKTIMPQIVEDFLEPLEKGLRITKGHYELKLRELNENKEMSSEPVIEVNVISPFLSGIPKEKEKEIVLQALNWMDIMESVWARANKLVTESFK